MTAAAKLDWARWYVGLGLSVIPIPAPDDRHDGKVPVIAWREFQSRRASEDEIRVWFGGVPMNVAIVTGAVSGVVVVDLDSPEAVHWWTRRRPFSPWQTRTGRGYHVFYRHPGVPVRNRARLDVGGARLALDVRGDGGYVIAPGSLHASGATYQCAGDWSQPLAALPVFWRGWLARPTRQVRTTSTLPRPTGDVVERARRYLAAIPRPEIGAGSDVAVLSAACRLVRGFELTPGTAEALLWEWCGGRAGWTRAWVRIKVQSALRYGSEPIGALR